MEHHHFECQCTDFGHVVRFTYDPDDGDVYLDVRLNPHFPWHKRLWLAVLYVFGRPPSYGHYDCTLLRPVDFGRLHDLLDRAQLKEAQRVARASFRWPDGRPLQPSDTGTR